MTFDTALFGWFFGVAVVVSWALRRAPMVRLGFLLAMSYAFYAAWSPKLLLLILFSTALDYAVAPRIAGAGSARARRGWLAVSLAGNLGLLAVFKYARFARDALQAVLDAAGAGEDLPIPDLILPVGISFYTFQTLSYTIDVYRGTLAPERNPLRFALFVVFFPQLVAGPIVRAADLLPQLLRTPEIDDHRHGVGLFLVLRGLVKKVAVADVLGHTIVDRVFDNPELYSSAEILSAVYGYAVQIYCDFSGYSDIAIGTASILGYTLNENFRRPYVSTNLQEFWRRWHVSLSTWLRDYLYVPLGGSRGTALATYRNLLVTMLLGGLWHGASWTFVAWGALHGLGLAGVRAFQRAFPATTPSRLRRLAGGFATFHFVCLAWVFFRSRSVGEAWTMLTLIGEGSTYTPNLSAASLGLTWGLLAIHVTPRRWLDDVGDRFARLPSLAQAAAVVATLAALSRVHGGARAFIYFQF